MPCRFRSNAFPYGIRQLRKHDWICFSGCNLAAMRKEKMMPAWSAGQVMRLLLIEDEPELADALAAALSKHGS